jgi:hypothetical protein
LRRVIFALATRTPSALVGFFLGFINAVASPVAGILGNTGVCTIEARPIGCVLMGPAVGLFLGIMDNSILTNLFKGRGPEPAPIIRTVASPDLPTRPHVCFAMSDELAPALGSGSRINPRRRHSA